MGQICPKNVPKMSRIFFGLTSNSNDFCKKVKPKIFVYENKKGLVATVCHQLVYISLFCQCLCRPSLLSAKLSGDHRKFSIEMDANRRAFKYFTECNDGYSHMGKDENGNSVWMSSEWDWGNNPLDKDFNHFFQLY